MGDKIFGKVVNVLAISEKRGFSEGLANENFVGTHGNDEVRRNGRRGTLIWRLPFRPSHFSGTQHGKVDSLPINDLKGVYQS